jgi:hypothetical protein
VWLSVLLAVAITLPAARSGLFLDDHAQELVVRLDRAAGGHHFWNLFDFCGRSGPADIATRIAVGLLPWWTLPNLSMALFRPLASATHYLDYSLWPDLPVVMHLENTAWYALLALLVAVLYRRIMGPSPAAALASVLFAVDEAHSEGVAWIAGRNTLMSPVFVAALLVAHDTYRRDGRRYGAALAVLSLLLGLASSEASVTVWAFLVPYAIWIDPGPARARWRSLLPLAVITACWQLGYRAAGYGVRGTEEYRDPIATPAFFFERVPRLVSGALRDVLSLSSQTVLGPPAFTWALQALSALLAAASVLILLRLALRRRDVAFWLCALPLSLLPLCAISFPPRLLFIPSIAGFALVAQLIVELIGLVATRGASIALRGGALVVAAALCLVHGPLALWLAPRAYQLLVRAEKMQQRAADSIPPHEPALVAYVLNTPNFFVTAWTAFYARPGAWPLRAYILGATSASVRVTRPDATSIVLEPEGGYLADPNSRVVRARGYGFSPGQKISMGGMEVTVEDTTPDGRPARVRFRSDQLSQPGALWITWSHDGYVRTQLPEIGTTSELPGV